MDSPSTGSNTITLTDRQRNVASNEATALGVIVNYLGKDSDAGKTAAGLREDLTWAAAHGTVSEEFRENGLAKFATLKKQVGQAGLDGETAQQIGFSLARVTSALQGSGLVADPEEQLAADQSHTLRGAVEKIASRVSKVVGHDTTPPAKRWQNYVTDTSARGHDSSPGRG